MKRACLAVATVALTAGLVGFSGTAALAAGAPLKIETVTAGGDDGNVPANTQDDDLETRWSDEGDGAWIQFDLGSAQTVGSVSLAWHQGDTRTTSFEVRLSGDGSSWTTAVPRRNSSGSTSQLENYDFADESARYVRVVGYGNTVNDWTSITEARVNGADGGGGGSDCANPADVLDLQNWYLGLPIGEKEHPQNVKQPELATYSVDPWFRATDDCTAVQFRAAVNGVTTSGSDYPRSELREMTDSGKEEASWSSTSGTHTMVIDEAITAAPEGRPNIVAGQIHGSDDDLSVFRLEGSKLYVTDEDEKHTLLTSDYELGTRFQAKFVVSDGKIKAYYNGDLKATLSKKFSGAYFKAGAYTQANCEKTSPCSDSNYGEVKIYDLDVSHE
ncbi:polysaccharide lyase family 7 protein [Amycolatopsis jiangsuensis]|uniref:F5/8 type C domain-containing protein n=1 Tax=Amycolatopsis jiangsuensis TaxID=1181879 RepID=A0A840J4L2_9PSEU|nr:polysaccharide lyase family 7 protein [Amycolatopsis jiangsuensis]MBB4688377.1 hypothetical protein [Amycolatopsis jiangsuensis]